MANLHCKVKRRLTFARPKLGPKLPHLLVPQLIDYIIVRLAGMAKSVGTGRKGKEKEGERQRTAAEATKSNPSSLEIIKTIGRSYLQRHFICEFLLVTPRLAFPRYLSSRFQRHVFEGGKGT